MLTWIDREKVDNCRVFFQAETAGQMLQQMQNFYAGSKFRVVNFTEAAVDDCWIKVLSEPRASFIDDATKQTGCALRVRNPGTHPGGEVWWIDILDTVYRPVIEAR